MKNLATIYFDGKNYLVVDSLYKYWGEGRTLDEAYASLRRKRSANDFLSDDYKQLTDISLIWLTCRKWVMALFFASAFVYAQPTIFWDFLRMYVAR